MPQFSPTPADIAFAERFAFRVLQGWSSKELGQTSAPITPGIKKQTLNSSGLAGAVATRRRASYSLSFKMEVVRLALRLPPSARIKPTCRAYPGIEPPQLRKWIRHYTPLIEIEKALGGAGAAAAQDRLHELPLTAPPINYRTLALAAPLAGGDRRPGHAAHVSTTAGRAGASRGSHSRLHERCDCDKARTQSQ